MRMTNVGCSNFVLPTLVREYYVPSVGEPVPPPATYPTLPLPDPALLLPTPALPQATRIAETPLKERRSISAAIRRSQSSFMLGRRTPSQRPLGGQKSMTIETKTGDQIKVSSIGTAL